MCSLIGSLDIQANVSVIYGCIRFNASIKINQLQIDSSVATAAFCMRTRHFEEKKQQKPHMYFTILRKNGIFSFIFLIAPFCLERTVSKLLVDSVVIMLFFFLLRIQNGEMTRGFSTLGHTHDFRQVIERKIQDN